MAISTVAQTTFEHLSYFMKHVAFRKRNPERVTGSKLREVTSSGVTEGRRKQTLPLVRFIVALQSPSYTSDRDFTIKLRNADYWSGIFWSWWNIREGEVGQPRGWGTEEGVLSLTLSTPFGLWKAAFTDKLIWVDCFHLKVEGEEEPVRDHTLAGRAQTTIKSPGVLTMTFDRLK